MDSCLSDADRFLAHEKATLVYLSRFRSSRHLSHIGTAAHQARYNFSDRGFDVDFSWDVVHDERKAIYKVHIGGSATCNCVDTTKSLTDISYYLAITEDMIVHRKYHFDYTAPSNDGRSPHPIFHLQFAGKLPRHMREKGYAIDHLYPGLSEPRILYLPMSLALVLHIAFSEFVWEDTEKIRKDGGWHDLIGRDQETLWKPYMQKCVEHINRGKLVFDEAYAN